jgi:hypothetical protein
VDFEGRFGDSKGLFKLNILLMLYYKRWVADNSAYEFLLCDLFNVREAELGE